MENPVLYIPIVTTVLSLWFSRIVFQRYLERGRPLHLGWWAFGIFMFGAGTFCEGFTAVFGWNEGIFRAWYITGALFGGFPLAQGTVYLLMPRRFAHVSAAAVMAVIAVATLFVILTPVDGAAAEEHRLTTEVIGWTWVRAFSPFVNTYAFIFLVGGAVFSAMHYSQEGNSGDKVLGNVFIAVGAILPGIGGTFTRMGYTEVLYVTELIGIVLIYAGFRFNVRARDEGRQPLARPGAIAAG